MTTMAMGASRETEGRWAFLVFVALVWVGVISGFGTDSFDHLRKHGLDYPLIVHAHAMAFVGWLVVFTVQATLIRNGRPDLHRRLGAAAVLLAGAMLVLGPATALVMDAKRFTTAGETPEFLAVQFTDIAAFAVLTGTGLLLRGRPEAHKRLMLLGLFYISDAGFARFLNVPISDALGRGFWGEMAGLYLGSDLLVLGFGAYELIARRRLHPAYVAGVAVTILFHLTGRSLLHSAPWKALSLRLIGH